MPDTRTRKDCINDFFSFLFFSMELRLEPFFLFLFSCFIPVLYNLQQDCDSAYNKLNSLQQKEFINNKNELYLEKEKKKRERRRQTHMYSRMHARTNTRTHARTHARARAHTHTHTHTHNSKLKFKQLNSPTNRSTTILTK